MDISLFLHKDLLKSCCCLVTKSCLTLCDSMDYSLPSSSVHGIIQARKLEWVAISYSRQENWSGLPFPAPGDLPNPEIEPTTPAWQVDSLPLSHQGPNKYIYSICIISSCGYVQFVFPIPRVQILMGILVVFTVSLL